MKKYFSLLLLGIVFSGNSYSQHLTVIYMEIDSVMLDMHIYYPNSEKPAEALPAIVFFFGGGWVTGDPGHFESQCEYLASRGIVALAADYRTQERHGTTPLECIADAKSAIRWIRSNSEMLGIQPNMLVAAGGSAGGHLAAACAIISDFDDPNDNLEISAAPNALVLFNPVISTYGNGFGAKKLGEFARDVSPLNQLHPGLPPTIIFHGTADPVVNIDDIRAFVTMAKDQGDDCTLIEYEGRSHGFFNKSGDDNADYWKTLLETEKFLIDRKFLISQIPEDADF